MTSPDRPPGRTRNNPTPSDPGNPKPHIVDSIDKAKKILGELNYIDADDDISEENTVLALRQMAAQLARLTQTKDLAKAASAIALIWETRATRTTGEKIMTAVLAKLDGLTTVRVSEKLTQISNRAVEETEKLESKGQEILKKIVMATDQLTSEMSKSLEATQSSLENTVKTYAQATLSTPTNMPQPPTRPTPVLEKRRLEGKQILLDFQRDSGLPDPGILTEEEWVAKANLALESTLSDVSFKGDKPTGNPRTRAIKLLRNGGIVLELDDVSTVKAIRENPTLFVRFIGPGWIVKDRTYTGKVRFVPGYLVLTRADLRERISADSGLRPGSISDMSWLLDPARRRPGQQVATAKIRFTDAEAMNIAIRDGILIGGKRLRVERFESEPPRCYNCHVRATL